MLAGAFSRSVSRPLCLRYSRQHLFSMYILCFIIINIMGFPSLCCLSHPPSFNDTRSNCKICRLEGVKIRKLRWNAGVFKFKCDHGPHTEDFYLCMGGNVAISDGGRKRSVDASLIQTTINRRAPPDYKEKDSNEFTGADNLYPAGYYNYKMEGVNFDSLSDFSGPDVTSRDCGRPSKVATHRTTARTQ
jgi:hypothetical protein